MGGAAASHKAAAGAPDRPSVASATRKRPASRSPRSKVITDGEAQSALLAYCASGSSNFFYLTSSMQILSTVSTIGPNLSKLRISK